VAYDQLFPTSNEYINFSIPDIGTLEKKFLLQGVLFSLYRENKRKYTSSQLFKICTKDRNKDKKLRY